MGTHFPTCGDQDPQWFVTGAPGRSVQKRLGGSRFSGPGSECLACAPTLTRFGDRTVYTEAV